MAQSLLRLGDTGPAVADIRQRLHRLGFVDQPGRHAATSVFDEALADGVRAFQQHRGIPVDGIVGPQTFRHIDEARWALGDRVLLFNPGHLMSGDDIFALQGRLVGLGFDCGRPDGVFGVSTDAAMREFQRNVGINADGTCGPETFMALDRLTRTVGAGQLAVPLREQISWDTVRSGVAGKVVVLDPGGADADEELADVEAQILADVCTRIEGRLAALGTQVLMTRPPAPELIPESERAAFANETGADLVVSLHVERIDLPRANGVATFYFGDPSGGRGIAGHHQRLRALLDKKVRNDTAALTDVVRALFAIGDMGAVGEIEQRLMRQALPDLTQHRESAYSGVEDADRCCAVSHGLRHTPRNVDRA